MKVYVLSQCIGWDYEGSSEEVLGLFFKFDDAFAQLRLKLPKAKRSKTRGHWFWDASKEQARAEGGDFLSWSITHYEVQ